MRLLFLIIFATILVSCSNSKLQIEDITLNEPELVELGINEVGCDVGDYVRSSQIQYGICNYTISDYDKTEIIVQMSIYNDTNNLEGSYQYSSLHLRGYNGMISENDYGDLSRFYVNNESDTFYYNLWITKEDFLIHVTSKGSKEAKDYVKNIGIRIISKI